VILEALDYREKAPLSAHKNMYLDSFRNLIPDMSTKEPPSWSFQESHCELLKYIKKFRKIIFTRKSLAL